MVLLAKDIMDSSFLSLDGETDALTCALTMVERRKGYAVVTSGGPSRIAGIVTEWDYLEKIVAPGVDPARVKLKDLASPNVQSCSPDTPTDEVVTAMANLGIRRMVVRKDDQVVGVITAKNILATFRQYVDKLSSEIAGFQSTSTPLG
jgi:CBS domain-containing protein